MEQVKPEDSRLQTNTEILMDCQTEIKLLIKQAMHDVSVMATFESRKNKIIDEAVEQLDDEELKETAARVLREFADKEYRIMVSLLQLGNLPLVIAFAGGDLVKAVNKNIVQKEINAKIYNLSKSVINKAYSHLGNSQAKVSYSQSLYGKSELNARYKEQQEMVENLRKKTNLVICDTHSDCSDRCFPWQGRVYSLDGTSGTTSDGRKYVPLEVATNAVFKGHRNGLLGYNCFDRETRVLTDKGWKYFRDLDGTEKFYTLNIDNRQTEWQEAIRHYKHYYDGEMIQLKSFISDIVVTPNHEMVYFTDKLKILRKKYAIDMSKWDYQYCGQEWYSSEPTKIRVGNEEINSRLYCKLLGYWLADGSIQDKTSIKIAQQNNEEMYNELLELPFKVWRDENKIVIRNKDLRDKFEKYGKCNEKYVDEDVKNLSIEDLQEFLWAYLKTDGYIAKNKKANGKISEHKQLFTTSEKMCADLCEIALKCGYRPSIYKINNKEKVVKFKNGSYRLNFDLFVINLNVHNSFRAKKSFIKYCDYVYCVEVPNHTLLVERNGKIQWCGNCRHKLVPYEKGLKYIKVPKAEQQKEKKISNMQRLLEREIRSNKDLALSFKGEDKAKYAYYKERVSTLTKEYKQFCQENNRVEYRSRLKV